MDMSRRAECSNSPPADEPSTEETNGRFPKELEAAVYEVLGSGHAELVDARAWNG
jgi:hypothetical protein